MKRKINGKTYNTETAREIGTYISPLPQSDFRWYQETLYVKRTGEFFLAGEGGAMSKYVETDGDTYCYGRKIFPLTTKESDRWVKKNMYVIRDREAGNFIDAFSTLEEAEATLRTYEEQDQEDGTYTEDFYEIVKGEEKWQ